jgi:Glyoxalase-like domain
MSCSVTGAAGCWRQACTSSARDRDQEIERLLALGARRVDIGQKGAESWTVLADPEGNEFCVIRPKETLTR